MRMLRSSSLVRMMGGIRSYNRGSLNLGNTCLGTSVSTAPERADLCKLKHHAGMATLQRCSMSNISVCMVCAAHRPATCSLPLCLHEAGLWHVECSDPLPETCACNLFQWGLTGVLVNES